MSHRRTAGTHRRDAAARRSAAHRLRTRTGLAALATLAVLATAGCGASGEETAGPSTESVNTTVVGTVTELETVTRTPDAITVSEAPTTVITTPTSPTLVPPPPTTSEPPGEPADCPYLTNAQVEHDNGQGSGTTTVIATEPYPVCEFTRSDGRFLAATRIVVADSAAAAAAAVNQHIPIADSFPVNKPSGWSGGAMATPDGLERYPAARSIYGVSKGKIGVIAISNQAQSIKGRQMAIDIIANLEL